MYKSDIILIIASLIVIIGIIGNYAFADSEIHITNFGIGKELTVSAYSHNVTRGMFMVQEEEMKVSVIHNGNMIDSDSCITAKRSGTCGVSFELSDGRYEKGWYDIMISIENKILKFRTFVWKLY